MFKKHLQNVQLFSTKCSILAAKIHYFSETNKTFIQSTTVFFHHKCRVHLNYTAAKVKKSYSFIQKILYGSVLLTICSLCFARFFDSSRTMGGAYGRKKLANCVGRRGGIITTHRMSKRDVLCKGT